MRVSVAALQLQLLLAEPGDWLQLLGLGRDGCYPQDLPVRISVCLSVRLFSPQCVQEGVLAGSGAGALAGAGAALSGTARTAAAVSPRPCRALLGLLCGLPIPSARPETRTVCPSVPVCPSVRVCAQGLGCAPLGREPAPAGDGLNVALPALTSAVKGSNSACPAHFLNLAGLFAGGKESRSAPRNASVGVFYLLKFFLLLFFMVA